MATIYPNRKDGKIISVKLKAYLGRDEQGKQIFRCKNWIPEKDMTEKKILALAEKEAILFEYEAAAQYEEEQKRLVAFLDKKCNEIDTLISANESTIEKLKEYRQSVIYEAVTGKVEI